MGPKNGFKSDLRGFDLTKFTWESMPQDLLDTRFWPRHLKITCMLGPCFEHLSSPASRSGAERRSGNELHVRESVSTTAETIQKEMALVSDKQNPV